MSFVSPYSGGTFILQNAASGTALDLAEDGPVTGWGVHGEDNQRWEVEQHESGKWTFRNKRDDKYLAVDGEAGDNQNVIAQDDPYEWYISVDEDSSNGFRIYAHPCFNIDLDNGSNENGARISVWGGWAEEQGPAPHQSWHFLTVDD